MLTVRTASVCFLAPRYGHARLRQTTDGQGQVKFRRLISITFGPSLSNFKVEYPVGHIYAVVLQSFLARTYTVLPLEKVRRSLQRHLSRNNTGKP
jgi:hypothetical protein